MAKQKDRKPKNNRPKNNKPKKQLRKWALFTGLAFEMGAIIGIAVYIGYRLDKKYPHEYPVYTIILSFLGIFAALYTVFKQVKSINEDNSDP